MRRRYRDKYHTEVDLPITPMLDMAFQLLTFFIISYHPSAMEGQFNINIMATEQTAGDQQSPTAPASPRVTSQVTPPPVTIIARAGDKGRLESLEIGGLGVDRERGGLIREQAGAEGRAADEAVERMLRNLEKKLFEIKKEQEELVARGGTKDERLLLQAQSNLAWKDAIRILGACRMTRVVTDAKTQSKRVVEAGDPEEVKKQAVPYALFPKVELTQVSGGS